MTDLGLSVNLIGDEGARALAGVLPQMASLTTLDLDGTSGEGVGGGAQALCEVALSGAAAAAHLVAERDRMCRE